MHATGHRYLAALGNAIDLHFAIDSEVPLLAALKHQQVLAPVGAVDMTARTGSQDAGVGQQNYSVHSRLETVQTDQFQSRGTTEWMRKGKLDSNARSPTEDSARSEQVGACDDPIIDGRLLQGVNHIIRLGSANDGCLAAQITYDSNVLMAPCNGLTNEQFVSFQEQIPPNSVDPKNWVPRPHGSRMLSISNLGGFSQHLSTLG